MSGFDLTPLQLLADVSYIFFYMFTYLNTCFNATLEYVYSMYAAFFLPKTHFCDTVDTYLCNIKKIQKTHPLLNVVMINIAQSCSV